MKLLTLATKDLLRSFRSAFLLVMMFVAPLLITGLLYFAFGSASGALSVPATRVIVANLDVPDPRAGLAAGELLAAHLQEPALSALVRVTVAPDAAAARAAVDQRRADVAVVIPSDLTRAVLSPDESATVLLYADPTLTVGPGIARSVVSDFVDGFSGTKIAVELTGHQLAARGFALDEDASRRVQAGYVGWIQSAERADLIVQRAPEGVQAVTPTSGMLGPVMAGMLVFFVFFTGASAASSIVREDEEGTLARLFTTPTSRAVILGGKCLAVILTLLIQTVVLLAASSMLFGIHWGRPGATGLVVGSMVVAATGFGVFLMSFMRNSRQTGAVIGGVLTITGLLGGLFTTWAANLPALFELVNRLFPQGWALRGWRLALAGAEPVSALPPAAVLAAYGVLLFAGAVAVFRRRFA